VTELDWPLPVRSLSPSSMAKFQKCPEQWRRQYLNKEWDRSSASTVIGHANHAAAEVNYRQKTETGDDLPMGDVELAYAEAFDSEVEGVGGNDEIDWKMGSGQYETRLKPGQAKDLGVPLTRKYHEAVSPHIQPVGVEEWFTIEVPGVAVPVKGKIDLIDEYAKTDLKFGRSAKAKPDVTWRLQGLTYMLVDHTREYDGTPRVTGIGGLPFHWHTGSWGGPRSDPKIMTPRTTPELQLANTEQHIGIANSLIKSTANAMLAYWRQFGPDDPWPGALQHSWACNYCTFGPLKKNTCWWWVGESGDQLSLI